MMINIALDAEDTTIDITIVDDYGLPVTGLVAATFPTVKYSKGVGNDVTVSLSDLAALTTAHTDGGVKERGEGVYRLDLPDGVSADDDFIVTIRGEATNKRIIAPRIQVGNMVEEAIANNTISERLAALVPLRSVVSAVQSTTTYDFSYVQTGDYNFAEGSDLILYDISNSSKASKRRIVSSSIVSGTTLRVVLESAPDFTVSAGNDIGAIVYTPQAVLTTEFSVAVVDGKVSVIDSNVDDLGTFATSTTSTLSSIAGDLAGLVAKFVGITLVANWLRLLGRKGNNNATAISEFNATTGLGTGTYDPTVDSPEAINDRLTLDAIAIALLQRTMTGLGGSNSLADRFNNAIALDIPGDQRIRDAMKLSPSAGTPEANSVDELAITAANQSTAAAAYAGSAATDAATAASAATTGAASAATAATQATGANTQATAAAASAATAATQATGANTQATAAAASAAEAADPQRMRDAMKLSPSYGPADEESIDEKIGVGGWPLTETETENLKQFASANPADKTIADLTTPKNVRLTVNSSS